MATERDEDLLARVAGGELAAFEELYARYARRLFGFALRMTRAPDLVDEVVNDSLLAVWRSAASFDGRSKVSTWIFGIAYRKALRALERRRRPVAADVAERPVPVADARERPDAVLERDEAAVLLRRAVAELPAEQRIVVELTFFQELSYPEIAAIVDCPVNTVKTRMFHARRKLRAALPRFGLANPAAG